MDKQNTKSSGGRTQERLFLGLIVILLATLFVRLFGVLQERMKDVDLRLRAGTIINLNAPDPANGMKALLQKGYYMEDPLDVEVIGGSIAAQQSPAPNFSNVGDLNKRKYNVLADDANRNGGVSFKKRVAVSRALLGFTGADESRFVEEKNSPPPYPAVKDLGWARQKLLAQLPIKEWALVECLYA